jgi:hypothetical protein
MLKIAHVVNALSGGGAERVAVSVYNCLLENVWKRIGKHFIKRFYKMAFKIIPSLNHADNLNPFLTD